MPQSIEEASGLLRDKKVTSTELVEASLASLARWEPHIHAWLEVLKDDALGQARERDREMRSGKETGPLHGIPVAFKDNILTLEGHTTAASKILASFTAPYEATAAARLKAAGAIIIGKTNLDEFAMGSSTEYSAYGPTKNPWDVTRVAGGSSGGSVAAVASGEVLAALGSDTGGSIRQPASLCNVVGLKPTYGRVSRFGLIAYGSSLDQIGPITRTVSDAARMLQVLAGLDERDVTSSPRQPARYMEACGQDIGGLKIGVPKEFFDEGISAQVLEVVRKAVGTLERQGAIVKEISLPLTSAGIAVYYLIAKAEASTNVARYDALRYAPMQLGADTLMERYMEARGKGFGPEVKRAILMGTYALSAGYYEAWYKQASKVRTLIRQEYEEAFKEVDVMAGPVSPEVAWPLGSKVDDPLQMYLADALTVPMSVAGLPALSVPCGFSEGLPVGLQLTAPHFQESRLFQVGHAYEQSQDWWKRFPLLPDQKE